MILCCGDALIDMIPAPTLSGATGFVPHPGGAVFNTAIGLAGLGVPCGLLAGLSTDNFGHQLYAALSAAGVDTGYLVRSDRPTTLAFVHLTNGEVSYTFHDENSAARMLTTADLPRLSADVSALCFSGISLATLPCAEAYAALLHNEGRGRAVMIDPNIRPAFLSDPETHRARLLAMLRAADIVKVSQPDLDWLLPGPAPPLRKLNALRERGPALALLTQGARGATGLLASGHKVTVPAEHPRVVDTVGAGDAFNAGVLAALHTGGWLDKSRLNTLPPDALARALSRGARVAAASIARTGATPGAPAPR